MSKIAHEKRKKVLEGQRSSLSKDSRPILAPIDFAEVSNRANTFADVLLQHHEELIDILLEYESFEVAEDELERTLDHLRSLHENKEYFVNRIGAVTAFLPRNQPLYALTCFVIVPSLMADEVHFRVPHSMRHFFPRLLSLLEIDNFFPNVFVSKKERLQFLKERSALRVNSKTEESAPVTDAVIFTGTPFHADRLRLIFDQRTLFIANGAGHNPLIVAEDANIGKAVSAAIKLQLYNQGQDCAAPNAILVHKHAYDPFIRLVRSEIKNIKIGHYSDRSCSVGPISDPEDLIRIEELLVSNRDWLDPMTPGVIRTVDSIVEPTLICKPLELGGNYFEVFAPLMFIQKYESDADLATYFENAHYARNAMYVTVYGKSKYVSSLIDKKFDGKILHDRNSILINRHLHMPGVERGTQPYGGYGYGASSFSIHGKITSMPTLPQRDIYQNLIKPYLSGDLMKKKRESILLMDKNLTKDVKKLMGLKTQSADDKGKNIPAGKHYVDALDIIASDKQRYIEFEPDRMFALLAGVNVEHVASMQPKNIHRVRLLKKCLKSRKKIKHDELVTFLYSLAKKPGATNSENKAEQLGLFRDIYQLLFARDTGPRLAQFLMDADRAQVLALLDV